METFFNLILDIEDLRILQEMYSISDYLYIYVPEEPVSSYEFVEESNKLRSEIGNLMPNPFYKIYIKFVHLFIERILEKKSVCMERAVVDIINMFIDLLDFEQTDSKGRRVFQLPPEKLNDTNWRTEGFLPIDKWDFIQFHKIYRTIYLAPEDVLRTLQFRNYENIRYELYHLRNDCMDLFSYYNSKIILALVAGSKRSLDFVRQNILRYGQHLFSRSTLHSLL